MNENELLHWIAEEFRQIRSAELEVGIGDDAAVLRILETRLVLTTDALHEGVHFDLRWSTPAEVGARAVEVNLSDLAAMGAQPRALLLALAAPSEAESVVVKALLTGFGQQAKQRDCAVVGGNLSRGSTISLTVTAIGTLPEGAKPLLRSGAKPGDRVFVSGPIGSAALGLAWLRSGQSITPEVEAAVKRYRTPFARVELAHRIRDIGSACLDLSDGLLPDAERLARASKVGLRLDFAKLPTLAGYAELARRTGQDPADLILAGGDDYELLFTASEENSGAARILGAAEVGVVTSSQKVEVVFADGEVRSVDEVTGRFEHFERSG